MTLRSVTMKYAISSMKMPPVHESSSCILSTAKLYFENGCNATAYLMLGMTEMPARAIVNLRENMQLTTTRIGVNTGVI